MAIQAMGDPDAAVYYYEKAVELDLTNTQAAQMLELLR